MDTQENNQRALEAQIVVDRAIAGNRLAPSQKAWAMRYYLSDRAGFESFLKVAPSVLSEADISVAERLNGHALTDSERAGLVEAKSEINRRS